MYQEQEDLFYYLTLYNENYAHAGDAGGSAITKACCKGIYRYQGGREGQGRGAALRQRSDPE